MIDMLIGLIVLCIIFGIVYYLLMLLPLPAPFKTIIQVACILIALLLVLGVFFGGVHVPSFR